MSDYTNLPYRNCVGILLVNRQGHIFTGERIDTPDAWQMPQGGIDRGETVLEAAQRELWEEVGLRKPDVKLEARTRLPITYDLPDELVGKAWGGRYRGQSMIWVKMRLQVSEKAINVDTKAPEFTRWRWATEDELLENIVPFKADMYREVLAELGT